MKNTRNILFLGLLFLLKVNLSAQCCFPFFSSGVFNCFINQSIAEYTINGSTPPHTFTVVNISTNATVFAGTVPTNTGTFAAIPVGNYNVFGATSAPGCTFTTGLSVVSGISPNNITFTTGVTCSGGSATALINGPITPPFTYTWSNGSNSQTAINLAPGIHTVTVTGSNGCTATNTVNILPNSSINSVLSNTFISCFNGSITSVISSTGGTSPYTYSVNGASIPNATVIGLSAGVVTISTADFTGCIQINTIQITQVTPPVITFSINKPLCPNSTNGSVFATVSNAPPALSYTWAPAVSFASSILSISAGVYSLTVKDGSACITKSVVTVTPATSMSNTSLTNPENCSALDGSFTLNISGGIAPYTFSTITVGTHTNNFLTGLSSGVYTTIVTDNNGCKDTIKTIVGNLSTVSLSILSSTPVLCYGNCTGKAQVSVQNGVAPFTYSATGTPTTGSSLLTNLCAGLITLKVVDANGCPATQTINFPVPPVFSYSAANPPNICIGKTVTLQAVAAGGVGAHNFVWNPGNIFSQNIVVTATAATVYSLNVYDSNNCTMAPFTVTLNVNPPLSININSSNSGICPGTTAQITPTVSGGDGNYSYNWMPGNINAASIFVQNIVIPVYTLTVNDACGSPTAIKIVTINLFPVIVPTFSITTNQGCEPLCTQFINTTKKVSNVIWNYGDKPFEQTGNVTNYCYQRAGRYNLLLTVNDSNNCKAAHTYTNVVNVIAKPVAAFVTEPGFITTNNSQGVLIKSTTTGGKTYQWHVNGLDYGKSPSINYSFQDTGCVEFRLIASNKDNCIDTLTKLVCVAEGFNFWIPNAFTPNGDGLNDLFTPQGTGYVSDNYLFEIFTKWGNRVFKTNDILAGWDGKSRGGPDSFNQYLWHISVTDNLGNVHNLRGFVTLLK